MGIKIITEPTIYLVGKPIVRECDLEMFLEAHDAGNWDTDADTSAEALPEIAGRLCYMSFANPRPGGNAAYLKHILEVGHGSVLEHAVFNFIITGVSRSFTHELVRHRVGFSYSQLSQRYVDESDVAFVVPPVLEECVNAFFAWEQRRGASHMLSGTEARGGDWVESVRHAQVSYLRLSDDLADRLSHIEDKTARRKAAREAARSVLPNCTETKIFVTANARALRHFIELRANAAADAEIRRVAVALLRVVQPAAPNLFGDYTISPCPLGGEVADTPYRKV